MILLQKTKNTTVAFLIRSLYFRKLGTNLESIRLSLQVSDEYRKGFQRVIGYALSRNFDLKINVIQFVFDRNAPITRLNVSGASICGLWPTPFSCTNCAPNFLAKARD